MGDDANRADRGAGGEPARPAPVVPPVPPLPAGFTVEHATPSVETYRRIRAEAGLAQRTEAAARLGLSGTIFAVQILRDDRAVGIGRLIGDGGCFYQVVDIAVVPEHQGKGLGMRIMREIIAFVERHVPPSACVTLMADGEAHRLYAKFGFRPTAPASIGMWLYV